MGISRRQVPQIETNYSDVISALLSGELEPFKEYVLTDFRTRYTLEFVGTVIDGPIEPIVVKALSNSELDRKATSITNPQDDLIFDITDTTGGADRGRILRRTDRTRNLTAPYDWRVIQFRRWFNHAAQPVEYLPVYIYDLSVLSFPLTLNSIVENTLPVSLGPVVVNTPRQLVNVINSSTIHEATLPDNNSGFMLIRLNSYGDTYGSLTYNTSSTLNPTGNPYNVTPNITWSDLSPFHSGCSFIEISDLNIPGGSLYGNIIFYQNLIADTVKYIDIKEDCAYMTFFGMQSSHVIGSTCENITYYSNCQLNKLGTGNTNIRMYDNAKNNKIESNCNNIVLLSGCERNTIGSNCNELIIGSGSLGNFIGNRCENIISGSNFTNNRIASRCKDLTFNNGCDGNIIEDSCQNNTFGLSCNDNIFRQKSSFNTFGDSCSRNILGTSCTNNTLGNNSTDNILDSGSQNNTLGTGSVANRLGSDSDNNQLGNLSIYNILGSNCTSNVIGVSCSSNIIESTSDNNSIQNNSSFNRISGNSSGNTISNNSNYNFIGSSSDGNTIGASCTSNTIDNNSSNNQIGNNCNNNKLAENCNGNIIGSSSNANRLSEGSSSNTFTTGSDENVLGANCDNNTINGSRNKLDANSSTLNITTTGFSYQNLSITGQTGHQQLALSQSYTPTSSADSNGVTGAIAWDNNYVYVKTGAGWRRSSLGAF
jgi:hypothetical protein